MFDCVQQPGPVEVGDGGDTTASGSTELPAEVVKKMSDGLASVNFSSAAKTEDGKAWTFKIASWDVNGIRALLKVSENFLYAMVGRDEQCCV